ncbi:MAG: DUF4136 domain-containing protein [Anaerohalosphaeraceae bacterium]
MKHIIFALISVTMVIGGCAMDKNNATPNTLSNVGVRTSFSPAAQFPKGAHFAFVQFAPDDSQDSEAAMIDQRIKKALAGELKQKGYKPGEYEDINFFVVYALGLQQQIDVLVAKSKVQGNEWIAAVVAPSDYVNGALVVQMIDAKTMEPVWLGVFNADVAIASLSEQEKQTRVNYAVRELLKQYPPK